MLYYGSSDVTEYMGGYPIVLFLFDAISRDQFPWVYTCSTQAAADSAIKDALAVGCYRIDQYGP